MVDVDARLAEIAERAEKAMPGPWRLQWSSVLAADGATVAQSTRCPHEAWFIAHAREDVPWLLAVLKEQAGQIERLQREATETVARGGGRSRASSDPTRFCRQSGPATYGDALCYCPSGACELDAAQATAERSLPDSAWPRCDSARPSASEASRLLTERDAETVLAALNHDADTEEDCRGCRGEAALDRLVTVLVARDAELAEVTQLRDALETVLDCRGDYLGTVSRRGGYPAICLACANKAREALAGGVPPDQAT